MLADMSFNDVAHLYAIWSLSVQGLSSANRAALSARDKWPANGNPCAAVLANATSNVMRFFPGPHDLGNFKPNTS